MLLATNIAHELWRALSFAFGMTWEVLWALILGFGLSAVVQAVVRKSTIVGLLGDDRPRTLAMATVLGAASSSSGLHQRLGGRLRRHERDRIPRRQASWTMDAVLAAGVRGRST